jgi:hypothetical protein
LVASFLVGAISLTLSGCSNEEEIGGYEVAREKLPDSSDQPRIEPPHATPTGGGGQLDYDTPEGWTQGEVRGMRKAAFRVADGEQKVEITVVDMPAAVGRMLLDNVNEWRRQTRLDAITQPELEQAVRPIEVAGVPGHYVELVGPEDGESRRAILAVVAIHGPTSWFFKLFGDADLVLREKEHFQEFVQSVSFQAPAESGREAPQQPPEQETPPRTVPSGHSPSAPDVAPESRFECDTPEGWTSGEAQGMRKAMFHVKDGEQAVEITATDLSADVGKMLLPNVNRWCKQIQRDEVTQEELDAMLRPVQVAGASGNLVELLGPEDAERRLAILGVVVVREEQAWFLVMKGDAALALREKKHFQDFVESVRFTPAEAPTAEAAAEKPAPKEATPGDASTEEAPAEKAVPKEATTEKKPAEGAETGEAPTGEAPTGEAPTGEAPTGEAPTGEAPTEQAPAEEAPASETPAEGTNHDQ